MASVAARLASSTIHELADDGSRPMADWRLTRWYFMAILQSHSKVTDLTQARTPAAITNLFSSPPMLDSCSVSRPREYDRRASPKGYVQALVL